MSGPSLIEQDELAQAALGDPDDASVVRRLGDLETDRRDGLRFGGSFWRLHPEEQQPDRWTVPMGPILQDGQVAARMPP